MRLTHLLAACLTITLAVGVLGLGTYENQRENARRAHLFEWQARIRQDSGIKCYLLKNDQTKTLDSSDALDDVHAVSIFGDGQEWGFCFGRKKRKPKIDLKPLVHCKQVRELRLYNLTLESIPHEVLTKLKQLKLFDCVVGSGATIRIARQLEDLDLSRSMIGGDVSFCEDLTELLSLDVAYSNIKDVDAFGRCTQLETLRLDGVDVNDLTFVEGLPRLKSLSIDNTKVTSIAAAADLRNLEVVSFIETSINDLDALIRSQSLQKIWTATALPDNFLDAGWETDSLIGSRLSYERQLGGKSPTS